MASDHDELDSTSQYISSQSLSVTQHLNIVVHIDHLTANASFLLCTAINYYIRTAQ